MTFKRLLLRPVCRRQRANEPKLRFTAATATSAYVMNSINVRAHSSQSQFRVCSRAQQQHREFRTSTNMPADALHSLGLCICDEVRSLARALRDYYDDGGGLVWWAWFFVVAVFCCVCCALVWCTKVTYAIIL